MPTYHPACSDACQGHSRHEARACSLGGCQDSGRWQRTRQKPRSKAPRSKAGRPGDTGQAVGWRLPPAAVPASPADRQRHASAAPVDGAAPPPRRLWSSFSRSPRRGPGRPLLCRGRSSLRKGSRNLGVLPDSSGASGYCRSDRAVSKPQQGHRRFRSVHYGKYFTRKNPALPLALTCCVLVVVVGLKGVPTLLHDSPAVGLNSSW